jgi:hypothetical protein
VNNSSSIHNRDLLPGITDDSIFILRQIRTSYHRLVLRRKYSTEVRLQYGHEVLLRSARMFDGLRSGVLLVGPLL